MNRTFVLTIATIALATSAAQAAGTANRVWVSGHGVDAAGCGPPTTPCRSLQYAHDSAVAARFVRSIPQVQLGQFGILGARPARPPFLQRSQALLGAHPASVPPSRDTAREIDLLSRFLFEAPERLADPERPRSLGPDGSVALEEYSGVDEELEAAVEWVGQLVLDRQVPLEEIALLVPASEPLVGMLVDRLGALPSRPAVHAAGGLAVAREAGGVRILGLVRALASFLEIGVLAELLPYLRATPLDGAGAQPPRLSVGEAALVASSLGTVGGSHERPDEALQWIVRLEARKAAMSTRVAAAAATRREVEAPDQAERADADLLELLQRITPPLEALSTLAGFLVRGESLTALGPAFLQFAGQWLILPGDGARIPALLTGALADLCSDRTLGRVAGQDALGVIEGCLLSLRAPTARFGDAALYVGTIRRAAGLPFRAVRILGLCEGGYPARGREDPVLPATLAASFGPELASMDDRILSDLHAFGRVVRGTTDELVLSVPRRTLDGTEHEPSFLLLEVAAALGRPDGVRGSVPLPGGPALRRTYFEPARAKSRDWIRASPLTSSALLSRAAATGELPTSWRANPALDLERMRALTLAGSSKTGWGAPDGILGDVFPEPALPGLGAEHPISASTLKTFLECPHRFLYEKLLGWRDPAARPSGAAVIDPMTYGSLFHEVVEHFYRAHGAAFGKHEGTLESWIDRALRIADERYAALLEAYPLGSPAVRAQEQRRLHRDVLSSLDRDWKGGPRRYVDVERSFGYDHQGDGDGDAEGDGPLKLRIGRRNLHVHGYIDRLDVERGTTLIRDVKTGKPRPRRGAEAAATPSLDVQLGVYALVAQALAVKWKVPARVAVAYDYVGRSERAFRDDIDALTDATREWLGTAMELMAEHQFPRTPDPDDCQFCRFNPICQAEGPARSEQMLKDATGALARFRALKAGGEPA